MSSKFGRGLYSAGAYSRDFSRGLVRFGGASFVGIDATVRHMALIRIDAASSVDVIGRLLWEHVPIEPCEGVWAPLVDTPCKRAA